MGKLTGKVAVVTGAGSGMGRASALLFAEEGAKVVCADVSGHEEAAADEIGKAAIAVHADVSQAADVQAMFAAAVDAFGRLDVVFNNAGFNAPHHPIDETDDDLFDRLVAVNLRGVFLGIKYAIPALRAAGGGSIINTASFVAIMGAAAPQIAYTASKGGVLSMTREIAVEFARQNIRANALCPGPVDTPLLAELLSDPARRQRRLVHIPMGRFARAEEIANAALFLASDESSYVNGATFLVDGGITAAYVTQE